MQLALDLAPVPMSRPRVGGVPSSGVADLRERLLADYGPFREGRGRSPLDQLVKAMISARTDDGASAAAFGRLALRAGGDWTRLVAIEANDVEALLGPLVSFAGTKAGWLLAALRQILEERGALSLAFLADMAVEDAVAWLTRLPGIGLHGAAFVLNASSLRRAVMVIDTHVLRVVRRYGLVSADATAKEAFEAIMATAPAHWNGEDFHEFHWLLKRTGQLACTHAVARCGICPLKAVCAEGRKANAARAVDPRRAFATTRSAGRPVARLPVRSAAATSRLL